MSEQETPRTVEEALTVEEAAAVESQRVYPSGPDHFVPYGLALRRYDFVAGATWQAARMPSVLADQLEAYSLERYGVLLPELSEAIGWLRDEAVALWGAL